MCAGFVISFGGSFGEKERWGGGKFLAATLYMVDVHAWTPVDMLEGNVTLFSGGERPVAKER